MSDKSWQRTRAFSHSKYTPQNVSTGQPNVRSPSLRLPLQFIWSYVKLLIKAITLFLHTQKELTWNFKAILACTWKIQLWFIVTSLNQCKTWKGKDTSYGIIPSNKIILASFKIKFYVKFEIINLDLVFFFWIKSTKLPWTAMEVEV